ncbi:hypothetical protein AVEN_273689-1 [Araneus ventricosus]|uniref:Uncharacterized protein n=1 Tax=Araneus ventricosus TaxID=182803 RepID=A0A4Y2WYV8_ARAVE|nr:hypothetical protein AVEN_273689-1 [Araneus ventricosus]
MKDGFAERFKQFKTNKSNLAFIVNPLNTNTSEINIDPFGIEARSLQMQMLDFKTKDLWSGKFTELKRKLVELEVQKCMHIAQHKWTALKEIPRVEANIFGALNSLPECCSELFRFNRLPTPAVATSSTDVERIAFMPLPRFTSNVPESSNVSIILFRPNSPSSGQSSFLNPLMSRNSLMQLPHSRRSCEKASQEEPDPSMIEP